MKLKQIVLAVAAVCASTQVFAGVTAADITAAGSNVQQTWLSGASAPTLNIFDGFALGCDAGTVSIFTQQAASNTAVKPGSIGNFTAYACKRGGVVSVMYHTVEGGSLLAYLPHSVPGTVIERVKSIGTAACSTTAVTYNSPVTAIGSVTEYKGCTKGNGATLADGAPIKPAGGFSDVEFAAFPTIINGKGTGSIASVGTESDANIGQVFGVAVTTKLYRAMQAKQGINSATDTIFDPALAPNITSAEYASIISVGGGYQADWTPLTGATTKKVVIARRVDTSGSQASSNIHFLNNPCASALSAASSPAPATNSGNTFIIEGGSTGNVKAALTAANNNTPTNIASTAIDGTVTNTTVGAADGSQEYAIGVISLENDWRTEAAASSQYRFLKLDGVHPEAASQQGTNSNGTTFYTARNTAVSGAYPFHMEGKYFVANSADSFGAALIPQIATALGNPAVCTNLPRGLTINPSSGSVCANADDLTTTAVNEAVVAKGTKFGNNCSALQLF